MVTFIITSRVAVSHYLRFARLGGRQSVRHLLDLAARPRQRGPTPRQHLPLLRRSAKVVQEPRELDEI